MNTNTGQADKLSEKSSKLQIIKAYFELCKPNVMYLAIITAITGMFLAPSDISIAKFLLTIIFVSMGAGAAGAFNMYFEMDIDAQMSRTSKRPLPSWRLKRNNALKFAYIMSALSVGLMALTINFLSSFLLLFTIVFYAYFYTLILKKNTVYNIVIGGIPGAIPPLIGWAAVENSLNMAIFSVFLIIFLWIPPHSWALALFKVKEYSKVNIPMLPVIKGRAHTINQIMVYSILMICSTYLPYFYRISGIFYVIVASILNIIFAYWVLKLYKTKENTQNHKNEKILFIFSINYLFVLFLSMIAEKIFFKFF